MANLLIAINVVILILGGPLTLYVAIKILNSKLGGLRAKFIKSGNKEQPLAMKVTWDPESFPIRVARIKIDLLELVPGGRSLSHTFTFEDSSAKKKSFILPMEFNAEDLAILTDNGLNNSPRALKNTSIVVEVETLGGETQRFKFNKQKLLNILNSEEKDAKADTSVEVLDALKPDRWSVQTRVFPWKNYEEVYEDEEDSSGTGTATTAGDGPRAPVDFIVTKVWIEPGCIVCDACETEAPEVFWVQEDTCIVRENAPLGDAAAIKAAAEGCPVDVIKFNKEPKPASAEA